MLFFPFSSFSYSQEQLDTIPYYHLDMEIVHDTPRIRGKPIPCIHSLRNNDTFPVIGKYVRINDTFFHWYSDQNIFKCGDISNLYLALDFDKYVFFNEDVDKLRKYQYASMFEGNQFRVYKYVIKNFKDSVTLHDYTEELILMVNDDNSTTEIINSHISPSPYWTFYLKDTLRFTELPYHFVGESFRICNPKMVRDKDYYETSKTVFKGLRRKTDTTINLSDKYYDCYYFSFDNFNDELIFETMTPKPFAISFGVAMYKIDMYVDKKTLIPVLISQNYYHLGPTYVSCSDSDSKRMEFLKEDLDVCYKYITSHYLNIVCIDKEYLKNFKYNR